MIRSSSSDLAIRGSRSLLAPLALALLAVMGLLGARDGAATRFPVSALADTLPPTVTLTSPNGGEIVGGGGTFTVTWTATDDVGVTGIDLFTRDADGAPWHRIAARMAHTGSFTWFVPSMPGTSNRLRAVAVDAVGHASADSSDGVFTIVRPPGGLLATTLRDFEQPGTQPFGAGTFNSSDACQICHGDYNRDVEPFHNWQGSMMSQSARDPLFYACLAIAEQDAPASGDLCIRCHSPFAWLSGRSQPTSGARIDSGDRDGVSCDVCHRAVDPFYKPGVSPPEDQAVLQGLLPAHRPTSYGNGQYVIDANPRRRGPFSDPATPHAFLESAFHRSSDLCGTCHDVSNPAFHRVGGADYAAGPLDAPSDSISATWSLPIERTYSEWKHSAFPAGVFAPEFAGNKADGIVSQCQDCHLRDVEGVGCVLKDVPVRPNLPLHDFMAANTWMPAVIAAMFPGEVSASALADGIARARQMLSRSAVLGLESSAEDDSFRIAVTVTNRTGHKLPTGYPDGRRMWIHVLARDSTGQVVYESGHYDASTGALVMDADARVYEAHPGLSPGFAAALGLAPGPTFHFVLNDTLYKDNRIPPRGFTNAAFAAIGAPPVDPAWPGPGPRYADGQNWDVATYAIPRRARWVRATLHYQSTSKEYVEFLRDANTTNAAGTTLYQAWVASGRAAPEVMATDSLELEPTPDGGSGPSLALRPLTNPFRDALRLRLDLTSASPVVLEVYDVFGRRLARRDLGTLGGGAHVLDWDAQGPRGAVPSGPYWVRVRAAGRTLERTVIRLR